MIVKREGFFIIIYFIYFYCISRWYILVLITIVGKFIYFNCTILLKNFNVYNSLDVPTQLRAQDVTTHSMSLSWRRPSKLDPIKYKVKY